MDVKIWTLDPMKLAYVEHIGPYTEVGQAWEKLASWAGPKGLFNEGTKFLGVYYDNPEEVPAEKLRSEACITVEKEFSGSGAIKFKNVAGGRYAVTVHLGPYELLVDSWMEFYMKWLPESGEECSEEPCYEQYMNNPQTTKPEHLVTLLLMPLK